jgi:hypothetical protein
LIYQNAVSVNGIFGGATVTLTGANTLHVASGFGIICGRFFEINESDISVQLSSSGTLNGRLKIHLDLNNADNPIEIVTETGATLPSLSGDSNININGGAFDMELCTFSVNELTISSLVNTFPTIDNTSKQVRRKTAYAVNDFVLCQSASDSLIFVCTTAGTTAVQEPTAYATVTDENTVTDGTAVFKAVNLMGTLNTKADQSALAIVETGNTCTHTGGIPKGSYVYWKDALYTADSAINVGRTFVASGGNKNLTRVNNGGLNELFDSKSTAFHLEMPTAGTYTITTEFGGPYLLVIGRYSGSSTATQGLYIVIISNIAAKVSPILESNGVTITAEIGGVITITTTATNYGVTVLGYK